jgi:hypothetical protein
MNCWFSQGHYEFEFCEGLDGLTYDTGWYRCIGGRLRDGRWPQWNLYTGKKRY